MVEYPIYRTKKKWRLKIGRSKIETAIIGSKPAQIRWDAGKKIVITKYHDNIEIVKILFFIYSLPLRD